MSKKYLQELIKNLQEFYKCPSCETNYYFDDIKLLGQIEPYCFVQLSCHSCSLPVLATLSVDDNDATKLKPHRARKEENHFIRKGAISALEIADFHGFISRHKGSISALLR